MHLHRLGEELILVAAGDVAESSGHRTGTNRTLKVELVRTSSASGVPDAGNLLSPSFDSATVLSGSTSARIERFGWISALGTATFHDFESELSSGAERRGQARAQLIVIVCTERPRCRTYA